MKFSFYDLLEQNFISRIQSEYEFYLPADHVVIFGEFQLQHGGARIVAANTFRPVNFVVFGSAGESAPKDAKVFSVFKKIESME